MPDPQPLLLRLLISLTSDGGGRGGNRETAGGPGGLVFKPLSHAVHRRIKGLLDEKKTANSFYDRLFLPLAAGALGAEEQFVTPMNSSASKAKFHQPPLNHLKYTTMSLGVGQCARSHTETEWFLQQPQTYKSTCVHSVIIHTTKGCRSNGYPYGYHMEPLGIQKDTDPGTQ